MNNTINVSLPKALQEMAEQQVKAGYYSSVSEVIRDGLRKLFEHKQKITINGFTEEFENEVLKAAKEPVDYTKLMETEEDIDNFFKKLKLES